MDECQNCGGQFFNQGQAGGALVQRCENCGNVQQPYRHQPGGQETSPSDMQVRNVPLPAEEVGGGADSGNPLVEGILDDNGWRNRAVRDEAFASTKKWASSMKISSKFEDVGLISEVEIIEEAPPIDTFVERPKRIANTEDPPVQYPDINTFIQLPWGLGEKNAAEFDITQVIPSGPKTVEIDQEGEINPLILQHDNQDILDEAKEKLSSKTSGLIGDLLGGIAGKAGGGLATGLLNMVAPEAGIPLTLAAGLAGNALGGGLGRDVGNSVGGGASGGEAGMPTEQAHELSALASLEPDDDPEEKHAMGDNKPHDESSDNPTNIVAMETIDLNSPVGQAFIQALPALAHFCHSEESGENDPDIQNFINLLQEHHPDAMNSQPTDEDLKEIESLKPQDMTPNQVIAAIRQFARRANSIHEAIAPPPEEMSYGDPGKFNQIPLNDYMNDPTTGPIIQAIDQMIYSNPNMPTDTAITMVAQQTGYPYEEIKHVYDTSVAKDWQGLSGAVPYDVQYNYQAPDYPPDMSTLPPAQAKIAADGWTEDGDFGYSSPNSNPRRVETDPDTVDPHQISDGNTGWQQELYKGEGDGSGSTSPFQDGSISQAFMNALPALSQYHDVPYPIHEDPTVQNLISVIRHHQSSYPETIPPAEPTAFPTVNPKQNPESQNVCVNCGSKSNGSLVCPFCNKSMMGGFGQTPQPNINNILQQEQANQMTQQAQPKMAALGPANQAQFAMLFQYLQQNGRGNEAAQVLENPSAYAQEMFDIQGQGTAPNPLDPNAGMAAGMPPPPPQEGQAPSNAGGPSTTQASIRAAADNVAPKCPFEGCGSHSTGVISHKEGLCHCHACGRNYSIKDLIRDDMSSTISSVHAALNDYPWSTKGGEPLQEGQTYEMYSAQYPVPDLVQVDHVTPNTITYTLPGSYGLNYQHQITKETANMDGVYFTPQGESNLPNTVSDEPISPSREDNNTPYTGSPEKDNLAIQSSIKVGGAHYTLREQREFIDEPGQARNLDALSLENTHYLSDDDFLLGF